VYGKMHWKEKKGISIMIIGQRKEKKKIIPMEEKINKRKKEKKKEMEVESSLK